MSTRRFPQGSKPVAAVIAHARAVIPAPAETVWEVLIRARDWPTWCPDCRWVDLPSAGIDRLSPGLRFSYRFLGTTTRAHVTAFTPHALLTWEAVGLGLRGKHTWSLFREGASCRVETEVATGALPRAGPKEILGVLKPAVERWVEQLAVRVSAR